MSALQRDPRRLPLERLPVSYREEGGILLGLIEAVSESRDRLLDRLAGQVRSRDGTEALRSLVEGPVLTPSDPAAAGPECRSRVSWPGAGRPWTAARLGRWLGHRTGVRPALWSRVRLVAVDPVGKAPARLRVHEVADRRCLAIVWDAPWRPRDDGGPVTLSRGELLSVCPVGCDIQLARVQGSLPRRPRLDGLTLEGELIEPWA